MRQTQTAAALTFSVVSWPGLGLLGSGGSSDSGRKAGVGCGGGAVGSGSGIGGGAPTGNSAILGRFSSGSSENASSCEIWRDYLRLAAQRTVKDDQAYVVVSKNSETVHDYCRERSACARSIFIHVDCQNPLILPRIWGGGSGHVGVLLRKNTASG